MTVLWTDEFGRLPVSQGTDGRSHNRRGFSPWLAGGFRRGYVHGATDDFGYAAVSDIICIRMLLSSRMDDDRLKREPEAVMLRTNQESGRHSGLPWEVR